MFEDNKTSKKPSLTLIRSASGREVAMYVNEAALAEWLKSGSYLQDERLSAKPDYAMGPVLKSA